ncbi:hypothetical protein KPL40_01345 [Clostridium gasigenes]|uniref:hypothetical protein n=1 Tax=Clostridium gasigenes TaxID=94869 RepID=UPI001C0B2031|nr:hypothetical protein [Clostridium gasigenes]MBU3131081.1 hypothetical protein [Clostridium gasigenes]
MAVSKVDTKFIGRKEIQISDIETKECNFYSIKTVSEIKETVNHHILLVDVSGSMCCEIEELKVRLKSTLDALRKSGNNYVSVILYSGHEETFTIINAVKCDLISFRMAQVYETLEEEVYARGITVMSRPLEESIEIVKTLAGVCDKHHIVLFTDGYLVPSKWNCIVEEEKCFAIADICNEKGIFLDAIGFGQYYDREFLLELVRRGNTGTFIHIDEIIDYYKTIVTMAQDVNNKELIDFSITNNDYFIINESTRKNKPEIIKVLKNNGENIIVVFNEEIIINDKKIKSIKKEISEEVLEDFFYGLALYHVINEDIESGEVAIAQTQDIGAYASLANCYSFLEKGKIINLLNKLIENKDKRFKKGKVNIKVQSLEEEPLCLLEVLKEILEDEESKLLWDYKYKYKRIGVKSKSIEDEYKFIYPKEGYGKIINFSIGSKKLNIGVKVEIKGEVQNTNNKLKLDAVVYRDYNLIVNGNINTTQLWCELSKKLKTKLRKEKIIKKTIKSEHHEISILDLTKLKATNKRLLKSLNKNNLAKAIYDIEILECKQWAVKKQIDELFKIGNVEKIDLIDMSKEEIQIRKMFRVDKKGTYIPLKVVHEETAACEIYTAKVLEWKIEKFPKKKEQENALAKYKELLKQESRDPYEVLRHELYIVKRELNKKRDLVNLVRLSSGLIGKSIFLWEEEFEKPKKENDKNLNMNMIVSEKMNVSIKNIDGIKIRQDKYNMLTKCT